jgi:hypothetical protein
VIVVSRGGGMPLGRALGLPARAVPLSPPAGDVVHIEKESLINESWRVSNG